MAKKVTKKGAKSAEAVKTRKPRRRAETKSVGKAATRAIVKTRVTASAIADGNGNGTISRDRIRERAYEIYRSGRNPSDPTADWFQAEQELRTELGV